MTSTLPRLFALSALGLAASCAPRAEPAKGPIGEQVQAAIAAGTESFDHSSFDALLADGVRDGLVDYEVFAQRREQLQSYLDDVAAADLETLHRDHLMALLINAYNAYTIESILDHPGVASIKEIDGVWDTRTHRVGGSEVTLDNLEHNLLRPYFKDPRIHVAVNCASMSCAPLPTWAFDGNQLEAQLDEWTRAFFSNPSYLTVAEDGSTLRVSRLLDWYGADFTAEGWAPRADTLAGFLHQYAPPEVVAVIDAEDGDPDITFFDYDWSLNRAAPPTSAALSR